MADASYRFRIYTSGSSAVEVTFGSSQLQGFEEIGGIDVRPLEGHVESRPWNIYVADVSTAVTSILADSSGRMNKLGRLAELQRNLDSSGWVTIGTGRVSDILLGDQIANYQFVLEDEHYLARQSMIFNVGTTTVHIYPPGLDASWFIAQAVRKGTARLTRRTGNLSYLRFDAAGPISQDIIELVKADLRKRLSLGTDTTVGNFETLRFRSSGADYEIYGWGAEPFAPYLTRQLDLGANNFSAAELWVVDPSAVLGSPTTNVDTAPKLTDVYLYMPDHQPTETLPLHLGGLVGVNPFQLVKDVYDSSYGGQALRYDSTALSTLITDGGFPPQFYRITEPANMGEWLETNVYGPLGVVPFTNADGRIEPQSVFLPSSDSVDIDTLLELTSTNLTTPHPTWRHSKREIVTKIRWRRPVARELSVLEMSEGRFAADRLRITQYTTELDHDRLAAFGEYVVTYDVADFGAVVPRHLAPALAAERFDRFGDGPIWGSLSLLSSGTSDLRAGQFATITLGTMPNPGTLGRGGTRIVQVMSRAETMRGPICDYLDVGPDAAVLGAPTISATTSTGAANSADAYHTLKVSIGSVTTDGGWDLQGAQSASTLASNSTAWSLMLGSSDSSQTVTIPALESGSTYFFRARNLKPQRWRSAWAYTTAGIATQELAGPSGLAATGITASRLQLSWTNSTASTGYGIEFQASTFGGTLATTQVLEPGTNRYTLDGLSGATTYTASVRYRDPYGGVSPSTSLSTETLSTASAGTCAGIGNFYLLLGDESTGDVYPDGYGGWDYGKEYLF